MFVQYVCVVCEYLFLSYQNSVCFCLSVIHLRCIDIIDDSPAECTIVLHCVILCYIVLHCVTLCCVVMFISVLCLTILEVDL